VKEAAPLKATVRAEEYAVEGDIREKLSVKNH
jgi:hypothetical protein